MGERDSLPLPHFIFVRGSRMNAELTRLSKFVFRASITHSKLWATGRSNHNFPNGPVQNCR
jgi:hypothetical protein